MRVKKYLALIFAAILATTMLTGCPWDIEDDEASENPGDEESEKPDLNEIFKDYGTVEGNTLTITNADNLPDEFRAALNKTSITKIDFDDGVASIPHDAFKGCTSLTSVDLSSVTYIEASAFLGCTNLTDIRLGADMYALSSNPSTGVHPNAFNNIASEVHVYYSDNANAAQQKWEELKLTMTSGTQVKYHPDSEWENREKNDNATEALPDAMKGLLALAERLG